MHVLPIGARGSRATRTHCLSALDLSIGLLAPPFDQFPVEQGAEAAFEASAPHAEAGCKCLHPVIVHAVIPARACSLTVNDTIQSQNGIIPRLWTLCGPLAQGDKCIGARGALGRGSKKRGGSRGSAVHGIAYRTRCSCCIVDRSISC